jgi:hypothetical protein
VQLGSRVLKMFFLNDSFFISSTRGIGILIFWISASRLKDKEVLLDVFTSWDGALMQSVVPLSSADLDSAA